MNWFYFDMLRDEHDSDAGGGGGAPDVGGGAPAAEGGGEGAIDIPGVTTEGEPEPQVIGLPEQGEGEPPAWTPNFKFKVGGKELEFDAAAQALVKDAASEKVVRELLEKAHGIDIVKESRQSLQAQHDQVVQQHQALTSNVQQLSSMVKRGDLEGFFEALEIPEKTVLQYALRRIQYAEASPEQRQAYDDWRGQMRRTAELEAQNQQLTSQFQSQSTQARARELDIALARPEVSAAAAAYEARTGKVGSFKAEVINRGMFWAYQQRDISVDQAVAEVLSLIGGVPGTTANGTGASQGAQGAGPAPQAAGATTKVPQAPTKKPVIPNIAGNGTSPAKVVPKSVKQLREMAQQMSAGT